MDYQNPIILLVICIWVNIAVETGSQVITFGPTPSILEATASRVRIKWDFWNEENPDTVIKDFSVKYRSEDEIEKPAMLVRNPHSANYFAQEARKIRIKSDVLSHYHVAADDGKIGVKSYVGRKDRSTILAGIEPTYMEITIDKLELANSNYRFDLSRTLEERNGSSTNRPTAVTEIASVMVIRSSTEKLISSHYPTRTGSGCFRVYDVGELSRMVRIYWQPIRDFGDFMVSVYEIHSSGEPTLVLHREISSDRSSVARLLSLNPHHVIFEALDGTWSLFEKYSMLYIPAQKDVLDAPLTRISWDEEKNITTLSWEKPEHLSVDNYTVFWMDTLRGTISPLNRIYDFTFLHNNTNTFKVKGAGFSFLGLSVNGKTGSSGLSLPCDY